jgi:hypothetical protein
MSLVVAFSCLLFSRPGVADRHIGRGSEGQHPCLLSDGGQEQQVLLEAPHDSIQCHLRAFASYAYGTTLVDRLHTMPPWVMEVATYCIRLGAASAMAIA